MAKLNIKELIKQTYDNLKTISEIMGKAPGMTAKDVAAIASISKSFKTFVNENLEQEPGKDVDKEKHEKEVPSEFGAAKVKPTL